MHAMRRDSLSKVPKAMVLPLEKPTQGLPDVTKMDRRDGKEEMNFVRRRRSTACKAEPTTTVSWQGDG